MAEAIADRNCWRNCRTVRPLINCDRGSRARAAQSASSMTPEDPQDKHDASQGVPAGAPAATGAAQPAAAGTAQPPLLALRSLPLGRRGRYGGRAAPSGEAGCGGWSAGRRQRRPRHHHSLSRSRWTNSIRSDGTCRSFARTATSPSSRPIAISTPAWSSIARCAKAHGSPTAPSPRRCGRCSRASGAPASAPARLSSAASLRASSKVNRAEFERRQANELKAFKKRLEQLATKLKPAGKLVRPKGLAAMFT